MPAWLPKETIHITKIHLSCSAFSPWMSTVIVFKFTKVTPFSKMIHRSFSDGCMYVLTFIPSILKPRLAVELSCSLHRMYRGLVTAPSLFSSSVGSLGSISTIFWNKSCKNISNLLWKKEWKFHIHLKKTFHVCAGDKLSGKVEVFEELSKLTDSISWPFINWGQNCPENDPHARQSYYLKGQLQVQSTSKDSLTVGRIF